MLMSQCSAGSSTSYVPARGSASSARGACGRNATRAVSVRVEEQEGASVVRAASRVISSDENADAMAAASASGVSERGIPEMRNSAPFGVGRREGARRAGGGGVGAVASGAGRGGDGRKKRCRIRSMVDVGERRWGKRGRDENFVGTQNTRGRQDRLGMEPRHNHVHISVINIEVN